MLFNIVNSIQLSSKDLTLFVDTFSYSLSCAIMPRFIMSIRELYDRDHQDRCEGLDAGFSIFSQPSSSENQGVPAIASNVGMGEGREGSSEVIELVRARDGTLRV